MSYSRNSSILQQKILKSPTKKLQISNKKSSILRKKIFNSLSKNLQFFFIKSSNLYQKIFKSSVKNLRFLLQQPHIYHRQNTTTSRQSVGDLSAAVALRSFLVGCRPSRRHTNIGVLLFFGLGHEKEHILNAGKKILLFS